MQEFVARTTVVDQSGDLELRREGLLPSNGTLIVDRAEGLVYFCFGYHGQNVFEALRDGGEEKVWLRLMT